ncbi:Golgi resident protein GCP60 [Bagarius yarrelli]|uniref:Golgi resident protein GCP60 n=1 Tax=Bagarius yarrelli TaxID=175774 RepID=A0A556UFB2_BAGYA|nr:Golgi resident protein GCP60 [Bagarius yarrelli]
MTALVPEDGLKTSKQDNTFLKENETNRPLEKTDDRRKWNVGNYWGFSLEGIFGLALKFFKEMNGKAFNPTYEENLLFVALQKQIFLGPYSPKFCPEVGFFDVLGNDRQDTAEAPLPDSKAMASITHPSSRSETSQRKKSDTTPNQCHLFIETKPGEVPIMAPSMWMMPEVNEFKAKMQKDAESMITVGRGEVLTVHIPTHHDGTTFFWEFATDYYDIAFGLYFEWPETGNSVKNEKFVESESANQETGHVEKSKRKTGDVFSRVSEVVPLFRRDSQENVYAGSHRYPTQGVYLLRFDNSYSLWRSKVVYYRVYYTS